jgi:penicillin-binding protein 1C
MTALRRRLLLAVAATGACAALAAWLIRPAAAVPDFAAIRAQWQSSEGYLLDRNGALIDSVRLDYGIRRLDWVPLGDVSTALQDAIVDGEDRRFWTHSGVDWRAALGAVRDNVSGTRRRGASTITMQVAALTEPSLRHGSSWGRKLAQVRAARAIEARWSKAEILEAYLNLLDFRGELQGIDAAARVLAGKVPSGLSLPDALVLAALLPAPGAEPARVVARACERARLQQLPLDCATIAARVTTMLGRATRSPPHVDLAPQVAQMLLQRPGERRASTLDTTLQRMSRAVLQRHLNTLTSHNARDGAALIVDNVSGDVLAYVGSAGADSSARHVDGVRAPRQAGSTLKPFLYGLALEARYLTAASLLDDAPINLATGSGTYIPQNYDHDFKGLVSVRTALGSSLNVPAVRTLVLVGVEAFRDRLYALGYGNITQDGQFYGYSLALGSAEVTLWQQVAAYRALARGGISAPLRLRPDDPTGPNVRVLGADASYVVGHMLSDRAARAATFGLDNNLNTPFWSAVKTGTSKDLRDNWCIGFSEHYTVGVWVGNFEGDSMRDVSGVTGAAPAWHDLITQLHAQRPSRPPAPPAGVEFAAVEFDAALEPPRREVFLAGTTLHRVRTAPEATTAPRITSPGNGMVIAIDPDIPTDRQRLPVVARGGTHELLFQLDGALLGSAATRQLWAPRIGAHRLALVQPSGRVVDQVLFTVR